MAQFLTYQDQKISVGDTLRIHQTIKEGDKQRVQVYEGILIAVKNAGSGKSITVRRISTANIGVEKIFPLNSPSIKKIEVKRHGDVQKSKLYYLRGRIGKAATKIREKSTLTSTAK